MKKIKVNRNTKSGVFTIEGTPVKIDGGFDFEFVVVKEDMFDRGFEEFFVMEVSTGAVVSGHWHHKTPWKAVQRAIQIIKKHDLIEVIDNMYKSHGWVTQEFDKKKLMI